LLVLLAAFAVIPLALPWLVGRIGSRAFFVAALLPVVAFVHAALATPEIIDGRVPTESSLDPSTRRRLSMRMDTLGWVLTLIVTGWERSSCSTAAGISTARRGVGLRRRAPRVRGAMYGLVLTDDIIVLVMFWEITSILSYLLIGFYHARREPSSRPAGAARDDARRPRDVRRRRHPRR
jgi:multicomponent Na+:H+ antiporter subunit A